MSDFKDESLGNNGFSLRHGNHLAMKVCNIKTHQFRLEIVLVLKEKTVETCKYDAV